MRPSPIWPGPGNEKQFGLTNWFFCSPCVGLQVMFVYKLTSGVPSKATLPEVPVRPKFRLVLPVLPPAPPPAAVTCAPLSTCVIPEICHPFAMPRKNEFPEWSLGRFRTYAALNTCALSSGSTDQYSRTPKSGSAPLKPPLLTWTPSPSALAHV